MQYDDEEHEYDEFGKPVVSRKFRGMLCWIIPLGILAWASLGYWVYYKFF